MRNKKTGLIIGLVIGFIFLFVILKSKGIIGGNQHVKVAIDSAQIMDIIESVSASGKIYPETEVKIKSDVSGEIVELPIEEGDSVQAGQLLVKVNPSLYSLAVIQAEATIKQNRAGVVNAQEMASQAKAQMNRAQSNFERNRQLYEDRVISKMEFEQLETEFLSAQASYEAMLANISSGKYGIDVAEANLSQAQENLRRTTILAPTSGIISQLLVKKGERVVGTQQMDGSQILTIADMGRMELRVEVSENDIARVKIGDSCILEVDAYKNQQFKGVVSKISVSSVDLNSSVSLGGGASMSADQVTNYTVHIFILPESYQDKFPEMSENAFPFKPGMSAGVEILTKKESGVLGIPINAVTIREGASDSLNNNVNQQVVFVFNQLTNKVEKRIVKTGILDKEFIQVTEGLKRGEQIVTAPYGVITRTLEDDMLVEPVAREQLFEEQ